MTTRECRVTGLALAAFAMPRVKHPLPPPDPEVQQLVKVKRGNKERKLPFSTFHSKNHSLYFPF